MQPPGLLVCCFALSLASLGCDDLLGRWPSRAGKTPDVILGDIIRWQQDRHVRASTGLSASECFTDDDLAAFRRARIPERIVANLKKAPDFQTVAAALRAFPSDRRADVLSTSRLIARPEWAVLGFIDPEGGSQTRAGHVADRAIAIAITDAFAAAIEALDRR